MSAMTKSVAVTAILAVLLVVSGVLWAHMQDPEVSQPVMVMTGRDSDVTKPRYQLAASQELFDLVWKEHVGDRLEVAAQGWPIVPVIDFEHYSVLFIFGGETTNANGFRVMEVLEEEDAMTVRFERDSYQTMSMTGEDRGDAVTPWAMILLPATQRTLLVEENVQTMHAPEPDWRERAAFQGRIGTGRVVPGTRQR